MRKLVSYLLNKRQKKKLAKRQGARHYDKRSALEASLKNENEFTIGWYKRRFGSEWKEEYYRENVGRIGNVSITTAYTKNDEMVTKCNQILQLYFNTLPYDNIDLTAYESDMRYLINNENSILQEFAFIQTRLDRNQLLKELTTKYEGADILLKQAVSKHTNLSKFLKDIVKYTKEMQDILYGYNTNFIMAEY